MHILRFSAVERFGVPIDDPAQVAQEEIAELMVKHSVTPQEVPEDLADITPPYWANPSMRYFLSRRGAHGPAVIDFMPRQAGAKALAIMAHSPNDKRALELSVQSMVIPNDSAAFTIIGRTPNHPDEPRVHEFITFAHRL